MAINGEDNSLDMAALNEKLESINRVVRQTQAATKTIADAPQQLTLKTDNVAAASADIEDAKSPAIDDLSLDNEDSEDNRNKRYM